MRQKRVLTKKRENSLLVRDHTGTAKKRYTPNKKIYTSWVLTQKNHGVKIKCRGNKVLFEFFVCAVGRSGSILHNLKVRFPFEEHFRRKLFQICIASYFCLPHSLHLTRPFLASLLPFLPPWMERISQIPNFSFCQLVSSRFFCSILIFPPLTLPFPLPTPRHRHAKDFPLLFCCGTKV